MKYYSTNGKAPAASLQKAVEQGLAEDRGLYMPEKINPLDASFFENITQMSFQELSYEVAKCFFGEDVPEEDLRQIVYDTLSFDCPVVPVSDNIYSLELFHGPTLAFKDVGARFMARMLAHFRRQHKDGKLVNVLVATSGDTGGAVANGFLGVEGVRVFVLYPKRKVSPLQESQFTTLGQNIVALEVEGVFDDCQALVKNAFVDADLQAAMSLSSANSINVARFLPQSFYYFNAYRQMKKMGLAEDLVACVPSGNFGNITAALFACRMGLPIKRFIAANNANDVFFEYLQTGKYNPRPSVQTLANAMDVGDPSNFARILSLYHNDWAAIKKNISGAKFCDAEILQTITECWKKNNYLLDPHGACGYKALQQGLKAGETGFFCETAHPAKFKETVERAIGQPIEIPARLAAFQKNKKQSISLSKDFAEFKKFLLSQC